VNFGIATINTPQNTRAKRYDCGRYGRLTAKEIATASGLTIHGVFNRIYAGFEGDELVSARHDSLRVTRERCTKPTMSLAMKLAKKFQAGIPTVAEIRKAHPMCKRNAQRWRQAMVDAKKALEAA
jgi:hypothetical protein